MELTPAELWSRVLESARMGMPEQSFRTWLSGTRAVGLTDGELLVEAPSDFHVEWVDDKYGPALTDLVERILGRRLRLGFRCRSGEPPPPLPSLELGAEGGEPSASPEDIGPGAPTPEAPEVRTSSRIAPSPFGLNERYTFERFVVGSNNQLAAAASHAVAESPGRIYNPLFLYGGVGLGKTHLMHAVGNAIRARAPRTRLAYISTEGFTNELVNAIQTRTTAVFRQRYREIDLLLLDDVHFLRGKEGTQEELFHTFNALYDGACQIVITCDRPPKELHGVEDRLVSRFEWGLIADLKPPDYETRVAILRKKADDDRLLLDDDVIDYIAQSCHSSVRELEGAVIKLLAYSSLRREEITVDLARLALQGMVRGKGRGPGGRPTAEGILHYVASSFDLKPELLTSRKRTREIVVPRQIAMYLIREILGHPLTRIGRVVGGRDHTTVLHSLQRVEEMMSEDDGFTERVESLRSELQSDPR